MNPALSLKGRARIEVMQGGRVVRRAPRFHRNLLLDQGLDNLATEYICDLFRVAVKGTGTTPTKEEVHTDNLFSWSSGTSIVTKNTPASNDRPFTIDDVGRLIRFVDGEEALITGYNSATSVDVDRTAGSTLTSKTATIYYVNQVGLDTEVDRTASYSPDTSENGTATAGAVRTFTRTFIFDAEDDSEESVTGGYSQSGSTVTRGSGSRDFTSADIGKVIHFVTDGTETTITGFTDATNVTVDTSATVASQSIILYGFTDYTEIGFSHDETAGDNLNIRILLDSAVRAYAATGLNPGQQLKVTYEMELTVSPATVMPTPTTYSSFTFSDPTSAMSSNKSGQYVIEAYLTSEVGDDGETLTSNALLDPCVAGHCALSLDSTALSALGEIDRDSGLQSKEFISDSYSPGSFSLDYTADFSISEAISSSWRSLMLYHVSLGVPAFTFLFKNVQRKDSDHAVSFTLTKSWDRNLA